MAKYAQLYETVGESKDMGRLLETNPLAASLFMISLARADVYGILPADPWDFRTKVCPAAAVPVGEVENALNLLCELGMYHRYKADERQLIYIMQYHSYQQVRWLRVGRPDQPLPDCWHVPDALKQEIRSDRRGNKLPEYFGLDSATMRPLPETAWTASGLQIKGRDDSRTTPGLLPDTSWTTPPISASASASNDSLGARESQPAAEGEPETAPFPDAHMAICNYPELMPAVAAAQPRWGTAKQRAFCLDLIAAIEDPNTPVTRQEVMGWLQTDGSKPSYTDRGDSYLRRMIGKREAAERASPGARADPVLAAHIARNGQKPADPVAAMIWQKQLDEARNEEVRRTA